MAAAAAAALAARSNGSGPLNATSVMVTKFRTLPQPNLT
jgi:hypothetical protein